MEFMASCALSYPCMPYCVSGVTYSTVRHISSNPYPSCATAVMGPVRRVLLYCHRAGRFSTMYTSNRPSASAARRSCLYSSDRSCSTFGTICSTGVEPYVSYRSSADTSEVRLMKFFGISDSMPWSLRCTTLTRSASRCSAIRACSWRVKSFSFTTSCSIRSDSGP
uniref:Uncharacterized protein n=1 Tax=Anopheles melas TaxID=34690 RepID=A0A182UKC5_9DIPT